MFLVIKCLTSFSSDFACIPRLFDPNAIRQSHYCPQDFLSFKGELHCWSQWPRSAHWGHSITITPHNTNGFICSVPHSRYTNFIQNIQVMNTYRTYLLRLDIMKNSFFVSTGNYYKNTNECANEDISGRKFLLKTGYSKYRTSDTTSCYSNKKFDNEIIYKCASNYKAP